MLEVCAAIIRNKNKFLICQRGKDDHFSSIWEFPGGKKEVDESSEECVKREIREELNIEIHIDEFFAELVHVVHGREILLKFFLATTISNEIELSVHQDYAWINVEEFENYHFMEADLVLFDKLKNL